MACKPVCNLLAFVGILLLCACGPGAEEKQSLAGPWHEFQGTWTATGSRNTIHFGGDRRAVLSTFNGSVVLAGPSRPGIGFRAEALVFSDTATGMIGRAVWTDEHGDKVFSELQGSGTTAHNKIVGTFVGGTGRYAGANGNYEFSWQFVIENEEGNVQGQSVGLNGRVQVGSQQALSATRGPRS